MANGEDRNLYLARLDVSPAAGGPETEPGLARERPCRGGAARNSKSWRKAMPRSSGYARATRSSASSMPPASRWAIAKSRSSRPRHEFLFGCNIYGFDHFGPTRRTSSTNGGSPSCSTTPPTGFYWRWYETRAGPAAIRLHGQGGGLVPEHGIRMKGHPLLWADEAGIPAWSQGQPAPEKQRQRVAKS